jgi:hypothetical protein
LRVRIHRQKPMALRSRVGLRLYPLSDQALLHRPIAARSSRTSKT